MFIKSSNKHSIVSQALAPQQDSVRIMVFQGSPRHRDNCPDQSSKTARIMTECIKNPPAGVEFDICDLAVRPNQSIIQPCKGCISTSNGYHCHWPCDCYERNAKNKPDLMHDKDIYHRLEKCDGFMVFTPVHWYAVSTVVKSLFDRIVCANLTLTVDQAKKLKIAKNADVSSRLEEGGKYNALLKNHLEGKHAAFFIHGDNGADDYREFAKTGNHPPLPPSIRKIYDSKEHNLANSEIQAVMPLVWQCRYSGIFVPENCIGGLHMNEGISYSQANKEPLTNAVRIASAVLGNLIDKIRGS